MGRFNSYQSSLVYTPQTFEKLAVLPMELKKRQDEMEAQNDLIGINIANTKVAAGYQDAYNQKRKEFEEKSASLAERMAAEGSGNPNLIKEFQNLKRQYNKDAAITGVMGAGAQEYKEQTEAEKLYTAYGIEKAKQGPEAVTANWKKLYDERQNAIKEGLAKDSGYVAPAYVHQYAPQATDITDMAKDLAGIIGSNTKERTADILKDLSGATIKDANGMLRVDTKSQIYKTNQLQVEKFAALVNKNLVDTASPVNQHLRYNGKDPRKYIEDVQLLAEMMTSVTDIEANKINPQGGGGAGYSSDPVEKKKDAGLLEYRTSAGENPNVSVPNYNLGKPVKLDATNARVILQRMEHYENTGAAISDVKEYNAGKQATIDFVKNLDAWDAAHGKEVKIAFDKIKPPGYKNYNDFIDKRAIMRDAIESGPEESSADPSHVTTSGSVIFTMGTNKPVSKETRLAVFDQQTQKVIQKAREKTGVDNLMFSQNVYGVGNTDESNQMIKNATDYLKNNKVFFEEQFKDSSFAYQIDMAGNKNVIEDVKSLNAVMADEIEVTSIATKNAKGVPSVGIKMTFGEGEKKIVKLVDLEVGDGESSIARGVITRMEEATKDPKTKYVLQSILDSASMNQIIPDSKRYESVDGKRKGASDMQSNMIITYNAASPDGGKGNTIRKDGKYQIISEGQHYAFKVKQKGDKDFHIYNVGDLIYDRSLKGNSTTDAQKQEMKNSQVAALFSLIGYDSNKGVSSFSEGVSPITPEDNGEKRIRMAEALKDYELTFNRAGASQSEKDAATNTFIERTKDIGLKSMNKATFLKN